MEKQLTVYLNENSNVTWSVSELENDFAELEIENEEMNSLDEIKIMCD